MSDTLVMRVFGRAFDANSITAISYNPDSVVVRFANQDIIYIASDDPAEDCEKAIQAWELALDW